MSALGRAREKFLDGLSEKYIYGRLPLLHALVFLIELVASMRLFAKFNAYYAQRPVLTTMVTNAVLGGVADTVAQSITAIKSRARDRQQQQQQRGDDYLAIEFRDLTKEQPATQGEAAWLQPGRRFDFERLARFMAWGFLMAPVQLRWYGFLSRVFPLPKGAGAAGAGGKAGLGQAVKRVAMDQTVFTPVGLVGFFSFMSFAEGLGAEGLRQKLGEIFVPTLKANYVLWPAAQMVNFRVMPIQYQIPFVSTVGIGWTAYLSLANSTESED